MRALSKCLATNMRSLWTEWRFRKKMLICWWSGWLRWTLASKRFPISGSDFGSDACQATASIRKFRAHPGNRREHHPTSVWPVRLRWASCGRWLEMLIIFGPEILDFWGASNSERLSIWWTPTNWLHSHRVVRWSATKNASCRVRFANLWTLCEPLPPNFI